jgi:hypothetical protein
MARCRARRFRPSGRARTAPHLAVPVESSEHQYGRKHARLATQPDDEPARLVGSTDRDRCRSVGLRSGSSSHLDCCAHLDGSGLHPECEAVRPHALPLHRTFLSVHDCAGVFACGRHRLSRILGWCCWESSFSREAKSSGGLRNTLGENSRRRAHHQVRLAAESCCVAAFSARIGVNGGLRAPIQPLRK